MYELRPFRQNPWVPIINNTGSQLPALGIVAPTGWDANNGAIQVALPDRNEQAGLLVLGWWNIDDGGINLACRARVVWALYDPADGTPAVGEVWGSGKSSHKLRKRLLGWRILVVDSGNVRVLAQREDLYQTSVAFLGVP